MKEERKNEKEQLTPIECIKNNKEKLEPAGTVLGIIETTNINYGMDKLKTKGGHGFAAERANHLYDIQTGKDAKLIGDNNIKNGADRLVNGVEIQSKYYNTASKSVKACFEKGQFKYMNSNGEPMKIEVASDQFDDAIRAMENKIIKGKIPGIKDPLMAKDIIKKGSVTYQQAKNIAKFCTVESLKYDAVNGAITAVGVFGISTSIVLAKSIWNKEPINIALKNACYEGLQVGGVAFATSILSSQLARTGINYALKGGTDSFVKKMGPKIAEKISNAFSSGPNIYGNAAMNNVSKLLQVNIITGIATVLVLSSFDVANIYRGRISGDQLFKNITTTTTGVAGGTIGWLGGAALGGSIGSAVPILGTVVGGFVGGIFGALAGGTASTVGTKKLLDVFIKDDANLMVSIIEKVFVRLAEDYMLSKEELEEVVLNLQKKITGTILKNMFSEKTKENREIYATNMLCDIIEPVVKKREFINLPSEESIINAMKEIFEQEIKN